MILLLFLSLAPILIILFYIYYRDKYEKEPFGILLKSLLLGAVSVIPIIIVEMLLDNYWKSKYSGMVHELSTAAYSAFIVAAFTEELFKFGVFFLYVWRNKNFNERFDGIVYAVFISLGFALVENILYVMQHGLPVAILRAFTAVPGHALFGVTMGYYLGLAKFIPEKRTKYIWMALFMPILLHGIYDFILMSQNGWLLLMFLPFIIFMWILNFKLMKKHSMNSVFKNQPEQFPPEQTTINRVETQIDDSLK